MAAEIVRITLENNAFIDLQCGDAYDCNGQKVTSLSPKPLAVLRCIAESSIKSADGTSGNGVSSDDLFKTLWRDCNETGNVAVQVSIIRGVFDALWPKKGKYCIPSSALTNHRYLLCHCTIVPKTYTLADIKLEELYARVTDDFRFVTAGDDSFFPQDETGTEQLVKRVLFFTGDCFLGMERKTVVPDKLLAGLFCGNAADDRVSNCILSKCLSPEEKDQEELDYKRMCAVWDELAGSDKQVGSDKRAESDELVGFIGKNLINSSRATSYANDYNEVPQSMADIIEYSQVLINARYQNILNRLAPYVAEKCGEKLHSLECDTDLIHAAQNGDKKEKDGGKKVVYAYIAALVLLFFDRAIPVHSSKFSQKKKRYQKALDRCIREKLPHGSFSLTEDFFSPELEAEKFQKACEGMSDEEKKKQYVRFFVSFTEEERELIFKSLEFHRNDKKISGENNDQLISQISQINNSSPKRTL